MSLKDKIVKKQLAKLGYDISNPKASIFRSIKNLIKTSVPSQISKEDMKTFLQETIKGL